MIHFDLEQLKADVNALTTDWDKKYDSVFFHDLVARLACYLGFIQKKEWYEAESLQGKIIVFDSRIELEARLNQGMRLKNYLHRERYVKAKEILTASTL